MVPKSSYAFITFATALPSDDDKAAWRALWPENWIVLSKVEHARRTEEYKQLVSREEEQFAPTEGLLENPRPLKYPRGVLLRFDNLPSGAPKDGFRSFVAKKANVWRKKQSGLKHQGSSDIGVNYVDHNDSEHSAVVRMASADDAMLVFEAFDGRGVVMPSKESNMEAKAPQGKKEVNQKPLPLAVTLLRGDDECQVWREIRSRRDEAGQLREKMTMSGKRFGFDDDVTEDKERLEYE